MRKVLTRMFTAEKYGVTTQGTVKEGFESCLKELPDLVILDVALPDGNGLDLCKRMKEHPRIKHIPIIILTGDATTVENRILGLEYGADDYVLKPFIPSGLLSRVAGIIKHSFEF